MLQLSRFPERRSRRRCPFAGGRAAQLLTVLLVALGSREGAPHASALAGGGQPATAQRPATGSERPVPFRAGEVLTYDVSWSTYVTAGSLTMTVRDKRASQGSPAYYIVAEAQPTPFLSTLYTLYYKADTLLDAVSLLPQRGSVFSREGKRQRTKTTSFDHAARSAAYELRTDGTSAQTLRLPAYTQDAVSAIYVLRAVRMAPGQTITMPVSDSGRVYQVRLTAGAVEKVRTGIGMVDALKIVPVIFGTGGQVESTRKMALWITTGPTRLPVRVEAEIAVGSFVVTLRDARGLQTAAR